LVSLPLACPCDDEPCPREEPCSCEETDVAETGPRLSGCGVRCCEDFGLIKGAVSGDRDAEATRREGVHEHSEGVKGVSTVEDGTRGVEKRRHENDAHLKAPTAALGPNHMPTSFPAAFPTSAMRCTPNGTADASRNHERSRACRACAVRERGGKGTGGVGGERCHLLTMRTHRQT
jgi:hypothetical protein